MSSVPPNTPPGAPPPGYPPGGYPPYDPAIQWRIYREQQKAAWRAQREAMRRPALRRPGRLLRRRSTLRACPSVVGPIVLIGVGVIAFLVITDRIEASQFLDLGTPTGGRCCSSEPAWLCWRVGPRRASQNPGPPWRQLRRAAHSARLPWPGRRRVGSLVGSAARPVPAPGDDFFNAFGVRA